MKKPGKLKKKGSKSKGSSQVLSYSDFSMQHNVAQHFKTRLIPSKHNKYEPSLQAQLNEISSLLNRKKMTRKLSKKMPCNSVKRILLSDNPVTPECNK